MGEVFRGRDTRLNRDVAIKILPPLFADDPERLARFEREAQILASLNHPNIAHIYGIEESSGRKALVMELVDGDDLSVRIARDGAMPLAESLAIARQIADALACAHEQNVIHRDLKPANVKVREDGTVKVLDFGLAKLADPSPTVPSSPVLSPTITSPATQLGVILGTAAYMAPEQARGKAVDKRADVWAFALVLYEMLTGKRAFEGSEISDTLAFVLTKDPDWSALPGDTPAGIRRLLRRCLHKERNQRLADMSDARLELDEALAPIESDRTSMAPAAPSRSRWAVAAVAAAILAAGALGAGVAWSFLSRPAPAPPVVRFTVPLPDGTEFTNAGRHLLTISPDGSRIVFVANQQLYLRSAGSTTPQPIAGSGTTGPVIGPVFSPDGEHLAYYSTAALRRISVAGGPPVTLAPNARNPFGINWTTAGIFVSNGSEGIVRIPAEGGQPQTVVAGSQDSILQGPQLLPGGEWLMFTVAGTRTPNRWDSARIVAQSLKSGERRVLIEGGTDARYVTTGHLLYALGGVVFGAPFDLEGIKVSGPARPVIEGVQRSEVTGASQFAVAGNGALIYLSGPADPLTDERRLALLDRSGTVTPIKLPLRPYETPRVSPDGTRIAVSDATEEAADIWVYELSGASAIRRLTFGGKNTAPAWSPDGRQIVFQSDREGDRGLYLQSADVSGAASRLTKAPSSKWHTPGTWSHDGQWLAFSETGTDRRPAIYIMSMKDRTVRPFHADAKDFGAAGPVFSPDGGWLAYHAGAGGARPQVFVEPFPATGARYQIAEGVHPLWSRDGTELFINLLSPGFFVYRIATAPRFTFSPISRIGHDGVIENTPAGRNYDLMPDGKRLVVVMRGTDTERSPREVEVVLNWVNTLRNP